MPPRSPRSTLPADHPETPAAPLTRRELRESEGRIRPAGPARPSAPARPHLTGEASFSSRRDRRDAEGHRARTSPVRRGASFVRPSPRTVALAVSGGLVVVAVASSLSLTVGAGSSAESASAGAATPTATSVAVLPATTASARVVLSSVSTTTGTVAGGTSVTLEGANLDLVAAVRFGDSEGSVAVDNPDQITLTAPPADGEAAGEVPVAFFDADGRAIRFDAVTDSAAAVTVDGTPADAVQPAVETSDPAVGTTAQASTDLAAPTVSATTVSATTGPATATGPTATGVLASTKVVASAITFAYTPDPAIEAAKAQVALDASRLASQLDYLRTYWSDYNSAQYGVIPGNDCVNFASQSLIARGWEMDGEWNSSSSGGYSAAWASSTAFHAYLAAHPERATPISNAERSLVKPGDIVQFDWNGSGDWDHTGVVTSVDGETILYSSHTADNHDQSIDSASAGRIAFWGL
ncbi:hypothetical protein C5C31_02400 [Rathayibacter rathayi]|uniref:IPT/TIG domain-containing protein n=1 Tax=Rathayibacter rathayi TaxID=33887 RepID=A0ABD6W918_RATRA|nr:amidase domain-containing protein [Rathayibacter rathayi]PPF14252.1 hypothetical protein C5C04_07340 [Rathayibacter rathayi]PPF81139.1 hypothetical protein C5C14_05500 [Rathayibacter rathayi]PPG12217.1 hypothetical protein C5C11_10240 [Rathayibacter rathayi]PPG71327.1 hypothetical protein C5C02_03395 [Rathayibacter rathayi]PPG74200.1 hypothetical protein C5C23_13750 [Rathayibacter rathayi]